MASDGSSMDPWTKSVIDLVREKLRQDREDAYEYDGEPPSEWAVEACMRIVSLYAHRISLTLESHKLLYGVFTEDDCGVSFVVQSLVLDRRLNCRISIDGETIQLIMIDEKMNTTCRSVAADDEKALNTAIMWVTNA